MVRRIQLRGHHITYLAEILNEIGYSGTDSDDRLEQSEELEAIEGYGGSVYNFVKSIVKDLRERKEMDIEITDSLDSICHACLEKDNIDLGDASKSCVDSEGEEKHTGSYGINVGEHYSSDELVAKLILFKAINGVASINQLKVSQDKLFFFKSSYYVDFDLDSMMETMASYFD
ncbi:DUF1284 domain-containing protein [Candidatus Woesearchaeota archaeon]|jgi:hypothetical protein|nr:DUF1284 domain-containing protein [Candidatus Woesearchaeota archaeon]MBT6518346.1 DUF1284 domain-containing protein [Candidatus Woesearchaeota archaeon]MBT7366643.1 DUF1284 domain-containing protein [Candidatus Woesearchaeota archaeon]